MAPNVALLTRLIDNEVIRAMGLPIDGWLAGRLHSILDRATRHFSKLFAEVDLVVDEQGLPAGALYLLRVLARGYEARGESLDAETIVNAQSALEVITHSARRLMRTHLAWQP
jgi:hypothetical protein